MKILRKLYYTLSPEARHLVRRIVYFPADLFQRLTVRKELIPPRRLIYTGSGDFIAQGKQFLEHFKVLGHLQPDHRVLDVGSGIGRMALPLTHYLSDQGIYYGFDIVEKGVSWCQKNISARYPNFHFLHVSLKNDLYSSSGTDASAFSFPYPDNYFDFCFATSVFTHLLPDEVENYVLEIRRVLRQGGRFLGTFFILDPDEAVANPDFQFPVQEENYRSMSSASRASNVAYSGSYIEDTLGKQGSFEVKEIRHGYWRKGEKEGNMEFQDMVLFEKIARV